MPATSAMDKALMDLMIHRVDLDRLKKQALAPNHTLITIDVCLHRFESLTKEVRDSFRRIMAHSDPLDLPRHQHTITTILDEIDDEEVKLKELRATMSTPSIPHATPTPHAEVRLPKLELPKFSGKITDWLSFKDQFNNAVHNNTTLSNAHKMTYLQGCLLGDAATVIKSMSISDANYATAWNLLTNRYQHQRELVYSIIIKMIYLPSMQPDSASSLRALIDTTNECKTQIEALKISTDKWDPFLGALIFHKLDRSSKQAFELSLSNSDVPDFKCMIQFLEHRAKALACVIPNRMPNPKPYQQTNKPQLHHINNKQLQCKLCNGNHDLFKCQNFLAMSPPDRHAEVKRINVCFNCLRDNHSSHECKSKFSCHTCKLQHHTLIHLDRATSARSNIISHTNVQQPKERTTILPTALVKIQDKNGESQICKAFLDWGATTSLITTSCAQRLGLKCHRSSSTELTGVGEATLGKVEVEVKFIMRPRFNGSSFPFYNVKAFAVQTINNYLPAAPCDPSRHAHINNLQLADPGYFNPSKVDILLGGDIIYQLLQDGMRKGTSSTPTAINSSLVWLVGGPSETAFGNHQHNFNYIADSTEFYT